ncbi:hypothetical protein METBISCDRAFT_26449 [Metschnikowia bicuspidata]|uniref:HSF-type DNA-binding domain-containing protein n=1 Tax=Metschnikowia bicuspidata TaxID=27322 RepID=A0A4P9ZF95_9ASCO|nr:hypothetical protein METBISCDRAFT_26449 [Metschnikowia bicuspidata]
MLNNKQITHLIYWAETPQANTFLICPNKEFSEALSTYFKHGNVASFVRQLHIYGFHKVSDSSAGLEKKHPVWEFRHSSGKFRKNDKASLAFIKRRLQLSSLSLKLEMPLHRRNSHFFEMPHSAHETNDQVFYPTAGMNPHQYAIQYVSVSPHRSFEKFAGMPERSGYTWGHNLAPAEQHIALARLREPSGAVVTLPPISEKFSYEMQGGNAQSVPATAGKGTNGATAAPSSKTPLVPLSFPPISPVLLLQPVSPPRTSNCENCSENGSETNTAAVAAQKPVSSGDLETIQGECSAAKTETKRSGIAAHLHNDEDPVTEKSQDTAGSEDAGLSSEDT